MIVHGMLAADPNPCRVRDLRHLSLGVGEANSKEAFAALRDALLGTGATGANGDLGGAPI